MAVPSKSRDISPEETLLAFRCHGMQLEGLRYPITPIGMHYLLIHFDIPHLEGAGYQVELGGRVVRRRRLELGDIMSRPAVTQPVTMECAGNGRSYLAPRPIYVPWFHEAIGTAEWTGTPLRPILEEAGLEDDAEEIVFTGWDRGVYSGVEHAFARSLPVAEAMRDGVILAWAINGLPLPPQHGYPLRLIVPGWYGMVSVKWLRSIEAIDHAYTGAEQAISYRVKLSDADPGYPVTRQTVRALLVPPGIPDLMSRERFVFPGEHRLVGCAWSGVAPIVRVEVSDDGGEKWHDADLGEAPGPHAWTPWRYDWQVPRAGSYVLCPRATDAAGNTQPLDQSATWNYQGHASNQVQRVPVTVRTGSPDGVRDLAERAGHPTLLPPDGASLGPPEDLQPQQP
jgi:sulfane dehydrogenase subunit SoxC